MTSIRNLPLAARLGGAFGVLCVAVAIVAALIPLSAISYHVIENPCRERMKSWAASWKQRRLALASAA